jgi:hypothetical protein
MGKEHRPLKVMVFTTEDTEATEIDKDIMRLSAQ